MKSFNDREKNYYIGHTVFLIYGGKIGPALINEYTWITLVKHALYN